MRDALTHWLAALDDWRRQPDGPADDRHWAPELETVSRDELRSIQSKPAMIVEVAEGVWG